LPFTLLSTTYNTGMATYNTGMATYKIYNFTNDACTVPYIK